MKSKLILTVAAVLFLGLLATPAMSQDEAKPSQMFFIGEDVVKPAMVTQYETAVKEWVNVMRTHELAVPSIHVSMREDFHYYYVIPVKSLADMETIDKAFGALVEKIGKEKFTAMVEQFDDLLDHEKRFVASRSTELSYVPETPRLTPEEARYLHWTFYSVQYGKMDEAKELAKDYVSLLASKGITDGYSLYIGGMGLELPMLAVLQSAKDPEDFWAQSKKNQTLLGEEGKQLDMRALALTRKIERVSGWARPDLSYLPEAGTN